MKLRMLVTRCLGSALVVFMLSVAFCATAMQAQQAPAPAQKQTTGTDALNLTAKSANVSEPGNAVRISILRWSTDDERKPLVAALDPNAPPPAAGGNRGAGGRGGRGGRGAAPDDVAPDPAAVPDPDAVPAGRGARGGGGRGARGGRGDTPAAPRPRDPIASFTAAIGTVPTIGYIWTNEVTGYSIKYAFRASSPDGSERIVLATDRRLGGYSAGWKPVGSATPTNYEFTVVEIRLDSKGLGEGKTSLTTKVVLDNEAKTVALENYAGLLRYSKTSNANDPIG